MPNDPRRIDDKHNIGLGAGSKSLGDKACTINEQGIAIVPLDVKVLGDGQILIRAEDPDYAHPGPEEVQQFDK